MAEYKFNEGTLIKQLKEYIDETYSGHYSKNKFQSSAVFCDLSRSKLYFLISAKYPSHLLLIVQLRCCPYLKMML